MFRAFTREMIGSSDPVRIWVGCRMNGSREAPPADPGEGYAGRAGVADR